MKTVKQLVVALIALSIFACDNENQTKNKSKTSTFANYIKSSEARIQNLSEQGKQSREKVLSELRKTKTYALLVDSSIVSSEYIPVLTTLNNAVRQYYTDNSNQESFGIDNDLANRLSGLPDGKDKLNFVIKSTMLLTSKRGNALPFEVIELVERYQKKYGEFGESKVFYDQKGASEKIVYSYDLTSLLSLMSPNDKKFLNKLYEANHNGISQWNSQSSDIKYKFPHIATYKGYQEHLKKTYPESTYLVNIDFEITARQLFAEYDANEVAADKKYRNKKSAGFN